VVRRPSCIPPRNRSAAVPQRQPTVTVSWYATYEHPSRTWTTVKSYVPEESGEIAPRREFPAVWEGAEANACARRGVLLD
jgi:hypothetical protein